MVLLPAGSFTPFLRLKAPNASAPAPPNVEAIGAFRLDLEPVTNAEFLDFVTAHPEWRRVPGQALVRRRPLSEALVRPTSPSRTLKRATNR